MLPSLSALFPAGPEGEARCQALLSDLVEQADLLDGTSRRKGRRGKQADLLDDLCDAEVQVRLEEGAVRRRAPVALDGPEVAGLMRRFPSLVAYHCPEHAHRVSDVPERTDLRALAEHYRKEVASRHEHVRLLGLPPEVLRQRDLRGIQLKDIFVPLSFVPEKHREQRQGLGALVREGRSVVVLGDPGMGKTTLLLFLTLCSAGAVSLDGVPEPPRVPLFLSLRELALERVKNPELSFLGYLALRARTDLSLPEARPALFDAVLRLGQATVLLDGLDEVGSSAARSRIAQDIRRFQAEYPRCATWVTSRVYGYTPDVALPERVFAHVRVEPLRDDQVEDFLRRWYALQIPDNPREQEEQRASLHRAIFRTSGVRRLAGNPLLLTLMAFIHRVVGDLPQDRGRLYEQCVEMLLRSWLEAKQGPDGHVERHPFEELGLHQERQKDYLAHLALHIQGRPELRGEEARGLIARDEALDCLARRHFEQSQRERPHIGLADAREEMRHFLDFIGDRAGLLLDRGGGKLSFLHLSFQEYLAAWVFTCAPTEHDNPGFFVEHLGDPAWEEVLLLRLYVVQRMAGGGGNRAFDAIMAVVFRELEQRDAPEGWLTLTRALRDNLTFTDRDRRQILTRAIQLWAASPAFSGVWFTALEEVKLFSPASGKVLAELLAAAVRGTREAPVEEAVACLHLEIKLFGLTEEAVARVQASPRLPEVLPHLAALVAEPALAPVLAGVKVEDWDAVFAALEGATLYELTLGWATGAGQAPGPLAVQGATNWMRRKLSEEAASRRVFAAAHAASDACSLFIQTGRLYVEDPLYKLDIPFAGALVPEDQFAQVGGAARQRVLHAVSLASERLEIHHAAIDPFGSPRVRWASTWMKEMLMHFTPTPTLFESMLDQMSAVFVHFFGRRYVADFTRHMGLYLGDDINRDFGHVLLRAFTRDFGKHFSRDFGRDFGRSLLYTFSRYYDQEFARAFVRDFGRGFERDLARLFVQNFGRGLGIAGSSGGGETQIKEVLKDDARVLWLINQEHFWKEWAWTRPILPAELDMKIGVQALQVHLENPLGLASLLGRMQEFALLHHLFAYARYMACLAPRQGLPEEKITAWFERHPVDVHLVAWSWQQFADDIQRNLGGLRGAEGALAMVHAQYASLMTGIQLDGNGTRWRHLLDTREGGLDSLLEASLPSAAGGSTSPPSVSTATAASSAAEAAHPAPADPPVPAPLLTWLHLSDIHFGHPSAGHRADRKLVLDKFRADVATYRDIGVPRVDMILVTGDIAWSAQTAQYEEARAWLHEVASLVGVDADKIFVVPGNHDVDRNADKDRTTKRLLRDLRENDESLDEVLTDAGDRALLAGRQRAYLDFVKAMGPACLGTPPGPEAPLWWRARVEGVGGLKVRLVGLNTALLAADDKDQGKLRVGKTQVAELLTGPSPAEDELVLVLGHHPSQHGWLADQRDVDHELRSRAHLHLTGHVHDHETEALLAGGGMGIVRVVAGAVHGDAAAPGTAFGHGYSFGAIVDGGDGTLQARIYPRRYSDRNRDFRQDTENVPKGHSYAEHVIPRLKWRR
ncbi:Hypothetical protein CAP_1616 [Chondromyces apiculatus DSM 436]|uniref:NACHT domain-containing protein n=1 Tax=Chondromyces apiculatus DSM 436 TaxID=1192034 RepID=A0A017STD8_9BACT|nr:Hypothetical protein CAP_1616 [Chondromyces apiculatus DSM 436]